METEPSHVRRRRGVDEAKERAEVIGFLKDP